MPRFSQFFIALGWIFASREGREKQR